MGVFNCVWVVFFILPSLFYLPSHNIEVLGSNPEPDGEIGARLLIASFSYLCVGKIKSIGTHERKSVRVCVCVCVCVCDLGV